MRRVIAASLLIFISCQGRADRLDDFIHEQMKKRNIAGLSLAVIDGGKIVKARGYGFTELGGSTPVTTETLFQAGSISKPVSALGALLLVEKGKLSLDEDVNRKLKSWKVPENDFTKRTPVTLRTLLTHTAGLTVHGFPGYAVSAGKPTLVQVLNGERPANTPAIRVDIPVGSKWRYSGGGYTVMQQLVQDVTGQPFPDYMRSAVLSKLGMTASTFEQPLPPPKRALAATGYYPGGRAVPEKWHVYPEMAAAGLWTTASDLARYAIGVQSAYAGKPGSILSRETARAMLSLQAENWGLGPSVEGAGSGLRFSHGGRDEGFDAHFVAYAETGQGAAVMINANDNSPVLARILELVAKEYGWSRYPVLPTYRPIADNEPTVTQKVRRIFEGLAEGKLDRSLYTPSAAAEETKSLAATRFYLKGLGALKSVVLVEHKPYKSPKLYRHRLTYEKGSLLVLTAIDKVGLITQQQGQPDEVE
jgi:CubicO group peptidase (beta-lactamase class C family)